jgi:hypothetical protein
VASSVVAAGAAGVDRERAYPVANLKALGDCGALGLVAPAEPDWSAERTRAPRPAFEAVLERKGLTAARDMLRYLDDDVVIEEWATQTGDLEAKAHAWRDDVERLAAVPELDKREQFAVLQQVASVLRTGLTNDVESRLR